MTDQAPVRWRRCAGTALLLAVLAGSGCSGGMDRIDRRTDRLVRERSVALSQEARAPGREIQDAREFERPSQDRRDPSTTNPEPDDLVFDRADVDRDVAGRLERYALDATGEDEPDAVVLDLPLAFQFAQRTAREFMNAEEEYILSAIRLLIERHRWGPRLFNDTSVQIAGDGDDGTFDSAVNIVNELRATQRLPYGGTVEARWVWRASEQLRQQVQGSYEQSSEIVLNANVPLLRGAGMVAREDLIQAERDLIYSARTFERFRRSLLVSIAGDYFALLETRAQIANQERQLESLRRLEQSTRARVEAGRLSEFQTNIAASRVLEAQASLASLRENYSLQLDRFKVRLGLPVTKPVRIRAVVLDLPEPEITPEEAAGRALSYRLDLQNRRDQIDDARRGIRNARNRLLPQLDFSGQVGVPTDPDERIGGLSYDPGELSYRAGVTFGLPLDREIERLQLRQSTINIEQAIRNYDQFRDNVILDARRAVREIELRRFELDLAERQVRINERRLQEQELKEDEVGAQAIVETNNDLLNSRNRRDRAATQLRNAILNYLLTSGQLRVARNGEIRNLPGLDAVYIEPEPMEPLEFDLDSPTEEILPDLPPELDPQPQVPELPEADGPLGGGPA